MALDKIINWKSQYYYNLIIEEDSAEIVRTTTKDTVNPGDDISSYPQKIQNIINAAWG